MSVTTPNVVEVTDADFEQLVIEGSKTRPVVVDLWAAGAARAGPWVRSWRRWPTSAKARSFWRSST